MSEELEKKIHRFIKWLLARKLARGEELTDKDYYTIGILAIYLTEREG